MCAPVRTPAHGAQTPHARLPGDSYYEPRVVDNGALLNRMDLRGVLSNPPQALQIVFIRTTTEESGQPGRSERTGELPEAGLTARLVHLE